MKLTKKEKETLRQAVKQVKDFLNSGAAEMFDEPEYGDEEGTGKRDLQALRLLVRFAAKVCK